MKNGKYTQRRSSPGSSEFHGPLPSAGCPQKGGGALGGGMNCDQPSNISGMLGNHDPSINGGVTMGATGQEFTNTTRMENKSTKILIKIWNFPLRSRR